MTGSQVIRVHNAPCVWQPCIEEWLKLIECQCSVITELPVSCPWSFRVNQTQSLISLWRCTQGQRKRDRQHRGEDRQQPCIYPCISISLMIIHVQSLYNSLEEAKCWAKAFIIEDLSEHYCFCCMKQTLQAIIMIIIICWETCSTQIGSMSVIKRCTPIF